MTVLAVALVWAALSVLTLLGLALLFSGRGRWERWAHDAATDTAPVPAAPVVLPLAG